ncbi:phosphotransferase family protein [Tenggerimyces flavus]|uniref:Phosphotransferase family protein n=1 Tax=Tenggerimyces flavus TaxID=1708749 RepID=A0ABV7YCT0_9ACTN|nr:phosphotransferase [Tenggerimyces flavus]MBM7786930.1 scyllo-inosamine 4-kinase [Tenggerimyces flavus]
MADGSATGVADQVLARFGSGVDRAVRVAFAYSNEVWLTDDVVVRIGHFDREIALAPLIPPGVGYPALVDHGEVDGWSWMASERIPGENLGQEAWPQLSDDLSTRAVLDLWARVRVLHTTELAAARRAGCTTTPFYALDPADAARQLEEVAGVLGGRLTARLRSMLDDLFAAMAGQPLVLAHTDASVSNAVWTPDERAIPVDLEFACVAPEDLDLEHLFRTLDEVNAPTTSAALAEVTSDLLARPGAGTRLRGYAVLRDLWSLRAWVRSTDFRTEADAGFPLTQLRRHAAGTSWLEEVL